MIVLIHHRDMVCRADEDYTARNVQPQLPHSV
ncbi:MAG: hypothetical protein J07HQX50_00011, partial [Haloquadratum sp. J07HQX50]